MIRLGKLIGGLGVVAVGVVTTIVVPLFAILWFVHAPPFSRPSAATTSVCSTFNQLAAYLRKHPDPTTEPELTATLSYVTNSLSGLDPPGEIREAVNATSSDSHQLLRLFATVTAAGGSTNSQAQQADALAKSWQQDLDRLQTWQRSHCSG